MKLFSNNEWGQLKSVVLGTVENFSPGWEFKKRVSKEKKERAKRLVLEACPQWYLDEVAEDLEGLNNILRSQGVEVLRPTWDFTSQEFDTPEWSAGGFDIYNVRDLHIVIGNKLVVSSPSSRFRLFENASFQNLFYRNFFEDGFSWISAPTPKLKGDYLYEVQTPRNNLEKLEDETHRKLSSGLTEVFHRLENDEIVFDAANIIRFGRDVLFLVSNTGNHKAAKWLQSVIPELNVHVTTAYRSSHLDSTILPLKEGLVLLNGARVNSDNVPPFLTDWDKIFFNDPAPVCEKEIYFFNKHRKPIYEQLVEMGAESPIGHISSPWAGLNVLSINQDTVLVHDRQTSLIRTLERQNLNVVPIQMRHCYTMLGGLHCVTLDVERAEN